MRWLNAESLSRSRFYFQSYKINEPLCLQLPLEHIIWRLNIKRTLNAWTVRPQFGRPCRNVSVSTAPTVHVAKLQTLLSTRMAGGSTSGTAEEINKKRCKIRNLKKTWASFSFRQMLEGFNSSWPEAFQCLDASPASSYCLKSNLSELNSDYLGREMLASES